MKSNGDHTVERIDHGVVPSNDLGRAYRFWAGVLGGKIDHLTNFNARGLNREVPQIIFFTVANHHGFGVALQDSPIVSRTADEIDGVVWGFEVAADRLSEVADTLKAKNLQFIGPVAYSVPSPIKESLFVRDPDGNMMELCVRRDPVDAVPQGSMIPLRRISHVRVEVTDLEVAKQWYRDVFGLVDDKQVPGERQVTLAVPKSGQLVLLRAVGEMSQRSTQYVRGPHIDFRISSECYPKVLERFTRREYYWGPDPTRIPWHEPGRRTVYGYDPFGNRFQIGEVFERGDAA